MKQQKEIAQQLLREKETSVCIKEKGLPDRWIVDTTEDEVVQRMQEYVAQQNKELIDILDEARLQLEYLQDKFTKTGTTESVLNQIKTTLAKYK